MLACGFEEIDRSEGIDLKIKDVLDMPDSNVKSIQGEVQTTRDQVSYILFISSNKIDNTNNRG